MRARTLEPAEPELPGESRSRGTTLRPNSGPSRPLDCTDRQVARMPLDLLDRLPAVGGMGWVLLAGAALIVGFSKSALPGAATIAAALFALVLPAKESTAALLLLLILGDVLALAMYRREVDVRTLVRLIPAVLLGLAAGALARAAPPRRRGGAHTWGLLASVCSPAVM